MIRSVHEQHRACGFFIPTIAMNPTQFLKNQMSLRKPVDILESLQAVDSGEPPCEYLHFLMCSFADQILFNSTWGCI